MQCDCRATDDGADGGSRIVFRPQSLLLAPFLSTLMIFVPNMRVMRDIYEMSYNFGTVTVAMTVACLAVSLAFMVWPTLQRAVQTLPRKLLVMSAGLYVVSQVALWIAALAQPFVPVAVLCLFGAVMGTCLVPLLVAWLRRYALDFRSILFSGGVTGIASVAITWFVSSIEPVPAAVAWCACAAVGAFAPVIPDSSHAASSRTDGAGLCASGAADDVDGADAPVDGGGGVADACGAGCQGLAGALCEFFSTTWLPLLGLLVYMFCSCMAEVEVDGRVVRGEFVGLVVASCIAIALCCMRIKTPLVLLVDKVMLAVLVALAIVLQGLVATSASSVAFGAHVVFVPIVFVALYALVLVAAVRGFSRLFVAGVVLSACCLAMLAGSALATLPDEAKGAVVRTATSLYYAIVLVDFGCLTWRLLVQRGGDGAPSSWGDAFETARRRRVDELADRCGLTDREREVMGVSGVRIQLALHRQGVAHL